MTTACRSLTVAMHSLLLVALIPLAIVQADVVFIPTPFLVATARHSSSSSKTFLGIARGGSDRPSFEEEYEDAYDEENVGALAADTDSLTVEEYDHEEFEVDMTEVAEEEETEAEELELEEEVTFAEVFQDSLEEVEEEREFLEDAFQEEAFEEEEAGEGPLAPVYEERMATDDDSSAFVDPMELADAYDEGEITTAGDEHSVLVATGGDSGSEQVEDEEGPGETTPEEAAETSEVAARDEDATTEITEEQKAILMDFLKYRKEDIKVMRPEIALLVLANGLRRPIEGMPANWYVEGASPESQVRVKAVKVALTTVALGVVAAIGIQGDMDLSQLTDRVSAMVGKIPAALAAIPAAFSSKSSAKKTAAPAAAKSSALVVLPTLPVADEVPELEEDKPEYDDGKPHSIKPSADHSRLKKEGTDMTWLDKGITKFENFFKAIFNIMI
jgi:hypothetical protein